MKGRPFLGAFCGFLFGLSLAGFLLTTGVLATDSVLLIVLPILFLLLGIAWAAVAPFKRDRLDAGPPATTAPAADPR
jgi:hypothetical protein